MPVSRGHFASPAGEDKSRRTDDRGSGTLIAAIADRGALEFDTLQAFGGALGIGKLRKQQDG
jgi:hypothetical protein